MRNRGEFTKIIATVGPATFAEGSIRSLISSGADIIRLNLSHGTLPEHRQLISRIRKVAKGLNREVGILLDLPGPKIRLPVLPARLTITRAHKVFLTDRKTETPRAAVRLLVPAILKKMLRRGSVVAIDDGKVLLRVIKVSADGAWASVVCGGEVSSHKGITVLGADLPLPALTADDIKALSLAPLADFIGVSFVKTADDIKKLRRKIKGRAFLVAKIETRRSLENLSEIIAEADAVMVARGDLGLAVDLGQLAILQKKIIAEARAAGKPVIVATQMLDSMNLRPLPTRAEILDVANAVIDNADAIMLSTETASGAWPAQSVKFMSHTADLTEQSDFNDSKLESEANSSLDLFVHVLYNYVKNKGVKVFLNEDPDLSLAKEIARHRLEATQIVLVKDGRTARQLSLFWGVVPITSFSELRKMRLPRRLPVIGRHKVNGQDTGYIRLEK